jgi:hypothetical protein
MSTNLSLPYSEAYTTFSGADIKAVVNGHVFGNLISISWNITREKAPIYVLGVKDPVSMSRGKRGIAGTLSFQNFERDAIQMLIQQEPDRYQYTDYLSNIATYDLYGDPDPMNGWFKWSAADSVLGISTQTAYYADQMPPMDVTLTYANEYGNLAVEQVFGIEILNEGKGVHIDDMAVETAMTFICRGIGKLQPVSREEMVGTFPGVGSI